MTAPERAMELMERYVAEVGRRLPAAQRADVEQELRSLLTEAIEERAQSRGRLDEEAAVVVLREFGQPDRVALRYLPEPQFLIGPRLYPAFLVTCGWVLMGVALAVIVLMASTMMAPPGRIPEWVSGVGLLGWMRVFWNLAFTNLALAVLVFAILERVMKDGASDKPEEWDPRELPAAEKPEAKDAVKPVGILVKIYFTVLLFVVVNFFPEYFGILFLAGNKVRAFSLSELGLELPLLPLNLWWLGAVSLNILLLRDGRWTRVARWIEFALGVFGAFILYLLIASGSGDRVAEGVGPGLRIVGQLLNGVLKIALLLTLVSSLIRLYRLAVRSMLAGAQHSE